MIRATNGCTWSAERSHRVTFLILSLFAICGTQCRETRKEESPREGAAPPAVVPTLAESELAKPLDPALEWAKVQVELEALDDSVRWLTVTKSDPETKGAWATGRFDATRNRLEITTRDAWEFSVDVGRVEIDWSKLVILRIDDRNTELKKRAQTVYHFVRGAQGQWEVRE